MDAVLNMDAGQQLGELLVQAGKLSPRDLERALAARNEMGGTLQGVLVQLGIVSELDVVQARSSLLGVPFAAAEAFPDAPVEVPGLMPEFLGSHACYPLRVEGGELHVAMAAPEDGFVVKALRLATGLAVQPYIALPSDIERALQRVEDGIKQGLVGGLLVLDREGHPLQLG